MSSFTNDRLTFVISYVAYGSAETGCCAVLGEKLYAGTRKNCSVIRKTAVGRRKISSYDVYLCYEQVTDKNHNPQIPYKNGIYKMKWTVSIL
jgi:hypothetical protein